MRFHLIYKILMSMNQSKGGVHQQGALFTFMKRKWSDSCSPCTGLKMIPSFYRCFQEFVSSSHRKEKQNMTPGLKDKMKKKEEKNVMASFSFVHFK